MQTEQDNDRKSKDRLPRLIHLLCVTARMLVRSRLASSTNPQPLLTSNHQYTQMQPMATAAQHWQPQVQPTHTQRQTCHSSLLLLKTVQVAHKVGKSLQFRHLSVLVLVSVVFAIQCLSAILSLSSSLIDNFTSCGNVLCLFLDLGVNVCNLLYLLGNVWTNVQSTFSHYVQIKIQVRVKVRMSFGLGFQLWWVNGGAGQCVQKVTSERSLDAGPKDSVMFSHTASRERHSCSSCLTVVDT